MENNKILLYFGRIASSVLLFVTFFMAYYTETIKFWGISSTVSATGFEVLTQATEFILILGIWLLFLGCLALIAYSVIDLLDFTGKTRVFSKMEKRLINYSIWGILGASLFGVILLFTYSFTFGLFLGLIFLACFGVLYYLEHYKKDKKEM